jgi:hypothetical protein
VPDRSLDFLLLPASESCLLPQELLPSAVLVAKPDIWFFGDFTSTVTAFIRHYTVIPTRLEDTLPVSNPSLKTSLASGTA